MGNSEGGDILNEIPDITVSDNSIKQNIIFQIIITVCLVLVFIPLRKSLLWLYAPNTRKKKTHPAYYRSKSLFTWFLPVITVSDVEILSIIGLDSFMVLQTLKLMYRMTFSIFLSLIPLCWLYYRGDISNTHGQIYLRFTVRTLKKEYYFIQLIYIYLITLYIFYMIHIYYKKHTALRQAYIRAPSLLTPVTTLKRLSFQHENFLEMVNIKARSVFLLRIPTFITNDKELRIFIEALGCGTIENCVLVQNTTKYETLTDERDYLIREIESELENILLKIIKNIQERAENDDNMMELYMELKNVTNKHREKQIEFETLVDIEDEDKENIELAKVFLASKNKYIKRYEEIDFLTYKLKKLDETQLKLNAEIKELNKKPEVIKPADEIIDLMNENNALYTRVELSSDVSFFSLQQVLAIRKNYHSFTLDLPINVNSGFVTFIDPKSAQMLPQCLISSRVFTCKAEPAPSPQDIIWDNINQGEVWIYFKRLITSLVFIIFNFVFYRASLFLIELMQIQSLSNNFKFIKKLASNPEMSDSINGILTPLLFNTLLTLSPIILTTLTYYEGVKSYSSLYYRLMVRYGYFLIYNGFLMVFFVSTTGTVSGKIFGKGKLDLNRLTASFGNNLDRVSVFFTNAIIQRLILGNLLIILKPVKLFTVVFLGKIQKMFGFVRSRRSVAESKMSSPINFGDAYPNLLLVFPMALTFATISPLMVMLASLYYFATYFVYKEEFLYAFINEYESGGTHWSAVSRMIIISLYILQASSISHFFVNHCYTEALMAIPLLVITYMFSSALETMFGKSLKFYPLNEQEELHSDVFTTSMIKARKNIVDEWEEEMDPDDPTIIRCDDLVNPVERKKIEDYPYRGAVVGLDCIMFPVEFFKKLRIIMKYDKGDSLEIFKEVK